MARITHGRAGIVALAVLLGGFDAPAHASVTTEQFLAIVEPEIAFLAAADRLADERSTRWRAFARAEAREVTAADTALAAWHEDARQEAAREAAAPTIDRLGPFANAITSSLDTLSDANKAVGTPLAPLVSAARLRASDQATLAQLAASAGFDNLYAGAQRDALLKLERAYKDFILNGDDETLRRIAVRELPRVEHFLAALRR